MPELKPCPRCGGDNIGRSMAKTNHYLNCLACGFMMPIQLQGAVIRPDGSVDVDGMLAKEWNAMPREPQWTKSLPTVEGWFWYISDDAIAWEPAPIQVYAHTDLGLCIFDSGSVELERPINSLQGYWWAGPIIAPPKPENF